MSSLAHILIINTKITWLLIRGGLDDTKLTGEKEYLTNFTETQKILCLRLRYNGVNSYVFVNSVEMKKVKPNDCERSSASLC